MTRIYNDAGEHVPVTVLRLEKCQVVAHRTEEKNGYTALQVGVGLAKVKNTPKAMRGHFAVAKVEPKRKLAEFRVSSTYTVGVRIHRRIWSNMTGLYWVKVLLKTQSSWPMFGLGTPCPL